MWVITRKTLSDFWRRHPDAEGPLREWYRAASSADWRSPADVRRRFSSASILPGNRAVFNIKGNDYRLVTMIDYPYHRVFIRFIGTHAEYDEINAAEI